MKRSLFRSSVSATLLAAICVSSAAFSQAINGAGSTFVNPAMSKWAYEYGKETRGVTVNYQSVGSGAGIAQYKAGTVDFGATDAPLSDKELDQMGQPTIHIPVIAGSEVLAYNVPGITQAIRLSGDVIADIYLGKIKSWNDARIQTQNTRLKLPATPITVVHRSDGSGTTYIFTDYLCAVSSDWKNGPSIGKTVNWPAGIGGRGNEGVAELIRSTAGSIGYVELAFAMQAKLTWGPIRNASGAYVFASLQTTTAAADAGVARMKKDIRVSVVNGSGKLSYPITGFTYVLLSKTPKDPTRARAVVNFMKWVLGPGQAQAATLQYAPLPKSVAALNLTALASIKL